MSDEVYVSTVSARSNLSEIINCAVYKGSVTVLTRRGKPVAAVVPLDALKKFSDKSKKEY